jgi:hypothetical protein
MTWNSRALPAARGRLSRYLGQLRQNLDAVGEQMREAVAHAVGRSVADGISEAVYETLVSHAAASAPQSPVARYATELSSPGGRNGDEPMCERQTDAALWRDRYRDDDPPPAIEEAEPHEVPSGANESRTRRWLQALAAGVQAAAWWLQRRRGPVSFGAALTVSTIAAVAALVGPLEPFAAMAASALGLASLLELLRAASQLLATSLSAASISA